VFGLYLHFGENSAFWINLGIQALATLWILQLTLRVLGMGRPLRLLAISLVLVLATALPWLVTTLLTDIFAGLAVLALFILVVHGERTSAIEKCSLFALMAFAAASHSATLAVLFGLSCIGWIARPFLRGRLAVAGLVQAASPSSPARRCWYRRISPCRDKRRGRPAGMVSRSGGCCRTASSRIICGSIVRNRS
jgi:hypothetical protein